MGPQDNPHVGPGDAFGSALLAHLDGRSGAHAVERSDGMLEAFDAALYFDPSLTHFQEEEAGAFDLLQGPVLDIGAGAGRFALLLQQAGLPVTALDVSPGAVEVCRRRGIGDVFLGTVHELSQREEGSYRGFLLMGNNLGLLESPDHAGRFLATLRSLAQPGALLIGTGRDPHGTEDPAHLAYHDANRRLGRLPGQLTLRTRYRQLIGDWFEYMLASPRELEEMVAGSPWRLEDVRQGSGGAYLALLRAL